MGLLWFSFVYIETAKNLQKTGRKAPRTFLRPLRRPCLENPKGSHWSCLPTKSCAMSAMCAIRKLCIGHKPRPFMTCHLALSKVSLGFLMVYWLFSIWRYLKSLQIIAEWLKVELRFAGDPSSVKASRFGHVSGIRELHLKRGTSETSACWICCACPKDRICLRFLKVSSWLGSSEIQNSTILLKWFRAIVENHQSIRSFFGTFLSHRSHCGLHQL